MSLQHQFLNICKKTNGFYSNAQPSLQKVLKMPGRKTYFSYNTIWILGFVRDSSSIIL